MIRFAAFDMDGTLVDVPSSWQAVHAHFQDNNAEALQAFLENRIDDQEFVRRDVERWWRHVPRISIFDIERILAATPLMPGAVELFAALRARQVRTAIVSGGIDLLARRIGRQLGVDYVLANGLRTEADGRLTGEGIIRVPVRDKESVLARIQEQLGFEPQETGAVGNSAIDVGLFRRARVRVAFRPDDAEVRAAATHVVESGDLRDAIVPLLDGDDRPGPARAAEPS